MASIVVRGVFDDDEPGFVPASGGGTSNFLRADGTWQAPPGVGGSGQPFGGTVVSPSALAGNTDNWDAFGGDAAASLVRAQTTGAAFSVTGMTGGTAGRICVVFNIGATGNISMVRESTSSTAGNRFTGPTGSGDIIINPGNSRMFWYDGTTSRWRPIT